LLTAAGGALPRHFLLMAGIGFDAHIVSRVDPDLKKSQGKLSYWITGLGELARRLDEFEVRVDGTRRQRHSAGQPRPKLRRQRQDRPPRRSGSRRFGLALFEGRNTFHYLIYLAGALADRLGAWAALRYGTLRRPSFTHEPRPRLHPSGWRARRPLPARIEIVPDALTLLVPAAVRL